MPSPQFLQLLGWDISTENSSSTIKPVMLGIAILKLVVNWISVFSLFSSASFGEIPSDAYSNSDCFFDKGYNDLI
jgi:hypothetical protein